MLLPWLLAVAAFFSPLWGQTNASVLVIQGGTLIDGSGVSPVANAMIVIEDGHIRQIGSGGEIPPGAQVLNASGKYIIPGLIDFHVHYGMPWLHRLYLANGVTSVRDLGGSIERLLTHCGRKLLPAIFWPLGCSSRECPLIPVRSRP